MTPRRWRQYLPAFALSGVLVMGGALGFYKTDNKLTAIQNQQAQMEQSFKQFEKKNQAVYMRGHVEADDEEIDLLLGMIPEARKILEAAKDDEQRNEAEKRLVKAWDLLQSAKQGPKEDLLDCHRVHTLMIEIGDRADALLRIQLERNPKSAQLARIAIPVERIQTKASMGTKIAWKEFAEHPEPGTRTDQVIEAGGLFVDLLEWIATLFRSL